MSITSLTEKIAADATVAVAGIEAEHTAQLTAIEAVTETELAAVRAEAVARLEKAKQQQETVVLSQARQAANVSWQSAKRAALNSVFDEAFSRLVAVPAAEYQAYYVARYRAVVPADAMVVRISGPQARVADTEAVIATLAVTAPCDVDTSIAAGLIVYTTSGVYDLTLDRLFATERTRLEADVSSELFT